jgi:hypothetical protein
VFGRDHDADVAGRRIDGAEERDRDDETDGLEGGKRNARAGHEQRASDEQRAQIVTRRDEAHTERQNRGAEQRCRGDQADLRRAHSDRCQINRQHDDGEAVAEAAQAARQIERQQVRRLG